MICKVCDGSGTLLKIKPDFEYWSCPACCGAGVRVQHGPAVIGPGTRRRAPRAKAA